MQLRRLLPISGAALLAGAAPAAAAPVLAPLKECYVSVKTTPSTFETEPVQIRDLYRIALRRLEPVGLVYLWPEIRG